MKLYLNPIGKIGSYKTPITKKLVSKGERVLYTEEEAKQLMRTGLFLQDTAESTENELFPTIKKNMSTTLPKCWKNMTILIKNGGGIGDCLIAGALATYLKSKECMVCLAVPDKAVDFVQYLTDVDATSDLVSIRRREHEFDVVLDVTNYLQESPSKVIDGDFYAQLFKVAGIDGYNLKMPSMKLPPMTTGIHRFLYHDALTKVRVIHTDGSAKHKWWNDRGWRGVISHNTMAGYKTAILGKDARGLGDIEGAFDCTDLSVQDQLAILGHAQGAICVDSCFLHVCGLARKRTVGIFGPTQEQDIVQHYEMVAAVRSTVGCDCTRNIKDTCRTLYKCTEDLNPADVCKVFDKMFVTAKNRKKEHKFQGTVSGEPQPLDLTDLKRDTRLAVVVDSKLVGGGELITAALGVELRNHFDTDILRLKHKRGVSKESEKIWQEQGFTGVKSITHIDDETFKEYDVVLWYGTDDDIPIYIKHCTKRPTSIYIAHTASDKEVGIIQQNIKAIDGVVCVTPTQHANILDKRIDVPVITIPNFVRELPKVEPFPRKTNFTLGFLGRFDDNKGVLDLIEAMQDIDADLNIMGVGTHEIPRKKVQDQIDKFNLGNKIDLLDGNNPTMLYESIDCLVIPSKLEGLPLVALEAGSLGIPVMATDIDSLYELFRESVLWISRTQLARSINEALEDLENIPNYDGSALKLMIEEQCSKPVVSRQYAKFLRNVYGESFQKTIQESHFVFTRYEGAGDVVLTLPTVRKLTQMFPNAKFTYKTKPTLVNLINTEFAGIVNATSDTGAIGDIDWSFLYGDDWDKGKHILDCFGGKIGDLHLDSKDLQLKGDFKIGFSMYQNSGAINKTKEWDSKNWKAVIKTLKKRGATCYQIGQNKEKFDRLLKDARTPNFVGLVDTIASLDLLICVDNATAHIAQAVGTPHIALFGKSSIPSLAGYDSEVVSTCANSCTASLFNEEFKSKGCCMESCEGEVIECMEAIKVHDVVDSAQHYLNLAE